MSLFTRSRGRPRVLGEVSFALGAAVVMGGAGVIVALATPPLRPFPWASPVLRLFLQAAVGFGLGWWGGLMWSIGLAFHARRFAPPPPLPTLMRATWLAAGLFAAITLAVHFSGASALLAIGGGVVACTLAARALVTNAARRQQP
jgi:hypothetical protein